MKRIFLYSLICVSLVACKNETKPQENIGEVVFDANIDITKASFDKTTFVNGDKIAVWITDNTNLANQANYVDYATFNFNGTQFEVPTGESKISFPKTGSSLKFWAVSPFAVAPSSFTSTQQFTHNIVVDQRVEGNFRNSDLLTAQNTGGVSFGDAKPELKFLHRMSKVVVEITSIAATFKGKSLEKVEVDFKSADKATVLMVAAADDQRGTVTASNNIIDINMNVADAVTNKFEAVVAPRSYAVGEKLFTVKATYGGVVYQMFCDVKNVQNVVGGSAFLYQVTVSPSLDISVAFTNLVDWLDSTTGDSGVLKPV